MNQENVIIKNGKEEDEENCKQKIANKIYDFSENCMLLYNCKLLSLNLLRAIIISIKLICQIVEFYILILLTNIIIEFKIIFICSTINIKGFIIISFIFNIIFDYISINVLTIYYYEFVQFSWLNYDLFFMNMIPSFLKDKNNGSKEIEILFILIRNIIIIWSIKSKFIIAQLLFVLIFLFFPVIKFLNVFIYIIKYNKESLYCILFYYIFERIAEKISTIYDYFFSNIFQCQIFDDISTSLDYPYNNNNMLEEMSTKKKKLTFFKFFLILLSLTYNIIILIKKKESFSGYLFVFLIYIFCFPFFIFLEFEPWFFHENSKFCQNNIFCNRLCYSDSKIFEKYKMLKLCNKFISLIYNVITLILVFLFFQLFIYDDSDKKKTIENNLNITSNFTGYHWPKNNYSEESILNSACYTKIHNLDFIQLTSLAKAAYLSGEINNEERIIRAFKKSVFSEEKNNYIIIKNMTFLTNFSDLISILKTDFEIKGKKPLTVNSLKGLLIHLIFFWTQKCLFHQHF